MPFTLATPSLLFGAISLLLLAYTNRFLAIAALIRSLHDRYVGTGERAVLDQILHLRGRLRLIQAMQFLGAAGFLAALASMFALMLGWERAAMGTFTLGLALLMASLVISMAEIRISAGALNLQLADLEADRAPHYPRASPDAPPPLP